MNPTVEDAVGNSSVVDSINPDDKSVVSVVISAVDSSDGDVGGDVNVSSVASVAGFEGSVLSERSTDVKLSNVVCGDDASVEDVPRGPVGTVGSKDELEENDLPLVDFEEELEMTYDLVIELEASWVSSSVLVLTYETVETSALEEGHHEFNMSGDDGNCSVWNNGLGSVTSS